MKKVFGYILIDHDNIHRNLDYIVCLTFIHLEVGSADGLPCPICGNTRIGTSVLCSHVHQDETMLVPRACYFVPFGIRLDPQDIFN